MVDFERSGPSREQHPQFGFADARRRQSSGKHRLLLLSALLAAACVLRPTGAPMETAQIGRIVVCEPAVEGGATATKDPDGVRETGAPGVLDAAEPKFLRRSLRGNGRPGAETGRQAVNNVEALPHAPAGKMGHGSLAMIHDQGIFWAISVGLRRQDTKAVPLISSPSPSHMYLDFYTGR